MIYVFPAEDLVDDSETVDCPRCGYAQCLSARDVRMGRVCLECEDVAYRAAVARGAYPRSEDFPED